MTLLKDSPTPAPVFLQWYKDYEQQLKQNNYQHSHTAVSLATCSLSGIPSVRTVLINDVKEVDGSLRFTNFTYYHSRKGQELEQNPRAQLCFYFGDRQVRIDCTAQKCSDQENDAYFYSRSRSSQINGNAKVQSSKLNSVEQFDKKIIELEQLYGDDKKIPRPDYWGGYHFQAYRFDFWEKSGGRLDDRFEFLQDASTREWNKNRLYP